MDKTAYKELKEKLLTGKKNGYDKSVDLEAMERYCTDRKSVV